MRGCATSHLIFITSDWKLIRESYSYNSVVHLFVISLDMYAHCARQDRRIENLAPATISIGTSMTVLVGYIKISQTLSHQCALWKNTRHPVVSKHPIKTYPKVVLENVHQLNPTHIASSNEGITESIW